MNEDEYQEERSATDEQNMNNSGLKEEIGEEKMETVGETAGAIIEEEGPCSVVEIMRHDMFDGEMVVLHHSLEYCDFLYKDDRNRWVLGEGWE